MFGGGYWQVGRFRGAPIRLHFSILLGLVVFSRFSWLPGFFVAFPCLVLLHELGHAILVKRFGHDLTQVELTGLGGACHWSGNASPFEEAAIAWGGVLAQLLLYAGTRLWLRLAPPETWFGAQVAFTFTDTNLWLVAINLMPIPPLDGARAWQIFSAWNDRGPANLPHGTWRDHDRNAQRAWFDKLRPETRAKRSSEPETDGPLSADAQQAIDRLLKNVTGKAKNSTRRE
ncbi:MAG TPA: hypothetical protein VGM44_03535 [Polyangiaceae bacterium]